MQIPAGWLSDRYGASRIYASLILFALGSFIAAYAGDIYWLSSGGGAGARAECGVMALTADLTREEVRTKAMAMIGLTIGVTFRCRW